jgi:hypothetical protein
MTTTRTTPAIRRQATKNRPTRIQAKRNPAGGRRCVASLSAGSTEARVVAHRRAQRRLPNRAVLSRGQGRSPRAAGADPGSAAAYGGCARGFQTGNERCSAEGPARGFQARRARPAAERPGHQDQTVPRGRRRSAAAARGDPRGEVSAILRARVLAHKRFQAPGHRGARREGAGGLGPRIHRRGPATTPSPGYLPFGLALRAVRMVFGGGFGFLDAEGVVLARSSALLRT